MPEELSPCQKIAAGFLARGWSAAKTARQLGISSHTIHRWRHTKTFRIYIAEKEAQVADLVGAEETRYLLPEAIKAVTDLLASPSATARLGAARLILNMHGVANIVPRNREWEEEVYVAAAHLIAEIFRQDGEMQQKALHSLRQKAIKPRQKRVCEEFS